jgi:ATP-dependent DNA helicase RecQ
MSPIPAGEGPPQLPRRDAAPGTQDLEAGLRRLGHASFRPGQREAVETLLRERRLLLVAPTGGGKSLVYQLPAILLPGTTLVVSPLISLMHDQVAALEARGVRATYLAATLDPAELGTRMGAIARGAFDLVYAAPERATAPGLRSLLRRLDCPLLAIDEAHCISEWGHDFRPDYLALGDLVADLPGARVLACTATATPVVRDEILARLGLAAATPQILRGFARPNLALRVREVTGRREREIDALLGEVLGRPQRPSGAAIVYAPTRRASEQEAARLARAGWRVGAYHAGLDARLREDVSRRFASRELDVVVATNAFGMGIDRADVRAVAHLAPPGSIEAYYQEVGRAGRDGKDAVGLLLVSAGDLARRRALLERDADAPDSELLRHKWSLFLELMRWAEGGGCRHDAILRYFGDEEETLSGCGRCDVCLSLADAQGPGAEATTEIVRKALSAVARLRGRFGLGAAAKLLRGDADPRLARAGLDRTPTFGLLAAHPEEWLLRLLRRCVSAGWVELSGGDRPMAQLSEEGAAVMRAERPARLLLPPTARPGRGGPSVQPSPRKAGQRAASATDAPGAADRTLFEALRRHRLEVARAEGVPPYVVASDRALREIAALRPSSEAALAEAHGIGPAKLRRYGAGLLDVVRRHAAPSAARPGPGPRAS